jgi:hypothetical protein
MELPFPALPRRRLSGGEAFVADGASVPRMTVLAFWQWAVSDLGDGTTRTLLAKYIVASALGEQASARSARAPYDLRSPAGRTVEVKCAAYLQPWGRRQAAQIRWSIRPARRWDPQSNALTAAPTRQADVYVLSLLRHQQEATLDPLNLDQWEFYVVPTAVLDERCGEMRVLSLTRVQALRISPVPFAAIRSTVDQPRASR